MILRHQVFPVRTIFVVCAVAGPLVGCDSESLSAGRHDDTEGVETTELDGSEATGDAEESPSAEVSASATQRGPEDDPNGRGYVEQADPPDAPGRLAVGTTPLEDNTCGIGDECATHKPVAFYQNSYFGGVPYEPDIPYYTERGSDGTRIFYKNDLPSNLRKTIQSYTLKGNCEFYHYKEVNNKGSVHGGVYSDQYMALTGVPAFSSYKIRCFDNKPPIATLYRGDNYDGYYFNLWDDYTFNSAQVDKMWVKGGIASLKLRTDLYPGLAIELRSIFGKIYDVLFKSRKVIPSDQFGGATFEIEVDEDECEPAAHCFNPSTNCRAEEGVAVAPTTMQECALFERSSYCTLGGQCVDPDTGAAPI